MIVASMLLLTQATSITPIIEYPEPGASSISIEALVDIPKLNPAQRFVLSSCMNLAVQRTQEYGNRDVLNVLNPGTRFALYQGADHLRIGLQVPPDSLVSGLSLLNSVLTVPSFLPETIKLSKSVFNDPWSRAYQGFTSQEVPLDHDLMIRMWQSIFQADKVSIAVGGHFEPGSAKSKWTTIQRGWPAKQSLPLTFPPKYQPKPNSVPLLIFDSKPIKFTGQNMSLFFLAANILSVGKESILWRTAREDMQISYRQESFLIPTEDGWCLRMAIATDEDGIKPESISELRTKVKTQCAALTQDDLQYAVGLGRGYLENQLPFVPILLGMPPTVDENPRNDLYLKHYWFKRFGFAWSTQNLLGQMQDAKLDDLKKLLSQIIDESNVQIL